ncbi:unnamed protein product [Brassica oleracea var. botrytis]
MEKKVDNKFTWVIKDFSSLQSEKIFSDKFVVSGCKWYKVFNAYPKGYKVDNFLSLYLEVPHYGSLPSGWRRHARYRLIVVNQRSEKLSRQLEVQHWFEVKSNSWGFPSMLSLHEINSKDGGFLVNGELKIAIEIDLLEIIGKVEVCGFHLLSSQVDYVSRMFEKHPETASEVHLKNPNIRTVSFLTPMAKQVGHKFSWVIKDFSSLREQCYSPPVQIGDCKWRLVVYPKGLFNNDHLSLFLEVADVKSLPFGWRRLMKFRLTIAKQVSEGPSVLKKSHRWFDQKKPLWGFPTMIPLAKIHDKNEGFLVNDQLMIVSEVDVLEVVGTSEKSEETNPLSQVYQVESVSSVQDSVVEFRARNQHLKTACTNVLLSLTQTLCQTPQELSVGDLVQAEKALAYMKDTGLEVEWLVKKLNEVKEKKEAQSG